MNKYLVNIASKNSKIFLFERLGNELSITEEDYKQFYFEPSDTGKFTAYDGTKLRRIEVNHPAEVKKYRSAYSYSSDIPFTKNYLIHQVDSFEKCNYKYLFMDIEILAKEVPNINKANQPVSCVSFFNSYDKKVTTFWLLDYSGTQEQKEKKLFDDMMSYIVQEKPDILCGWNFTEFDFPYLFNRYNFLFQAKKNFSEVISPINLSHSGNSEYMTENPAGISIMDYLGMFKKVFMREPSYTLDAVCQKYLKDQAWGTSDFGKLTSDIKDKNINDVLRLSELERKFNLFEYFDEIRRLTKTEWEDLLMNSFIIENLVMQQAKKKNLILPNKPKKEDDDGEAKFEGAAREAVKTGALFDLGKFDLTSAYPTMMIEFCLDSSNIVDDDSGIELNGYRFQQDSTALIPSMVKDILTLKDALKAELKKLQPKTPEYEATKIKYDAIKGVANCFTPDTDILTPDGARNIKDLKVGDKVYNVNPKTLKVEIDTVLATQEENYAGKMYHYTNCADLKVTKEHRFLVKHKDKEVCEFKTISELYKETNRHLYSIPKIAQINEANESEELFSFFKLLSQHNGEVYVIPSYENRYKLRNVIPDGFTRITTNKLSESKSRKGWRRAKASAIKEDDLLKLHLAGWDVRGRITASTKMTKIFVNRKEWLKFLGWYISEGNCYKSKRKEYAVNTRGESYKISISQHKVHPEFRKEILECLKSLGLTIGVSSEGFSFCSELMFLYLEREVLKYSHNKKIPDFVFSEPIENIKILFDSLYKGDGNKRDKRYNTASLALANQVSKILIMLGANKVRIKTQTSHRYKNGKFYRIGWSYSSHGISKEFITTEDYNDKVYCVTTNNGTVFAGRNGYFSLTGQSAFGGIGFPSFRLYDNRIASTITWLVRNLLEYTREQVKSLGYEVIYYDTDSVFLTCKDNISDVLNSYIQDWAKSKGKQKIDLRYEYEGYFSKIFIIALCRYIGYLVTNKGVIVETKGAEAKRSDSSAYVREFQPKLIDKILNKERKEDIVKWVNKEKSNIRTCPIEYVSVPCKIPTKEYGKIGKHGRKNSLPIFVRAINNTNSIKKLEVPVGEVIWWAYVVPKTQDLEGKDMDVFAFTRDDMEVVQRQKIDWERMIERNIMSKATAIFEANGWSTFDLESVGQTQLF